MLAERFTQDPLETYFCKQHPSRARKENLPLYDFGYANTFRNQIAFKPIVTGSARDENTDFGSDRTSSLSGKIQTKQFLRSSEVSSSHQIPSFQTNTTSNSIFHSVILSLISVCFVVMENFFNRYIKKLLKIKK